MDDPLPPSRVVTLTTAHGPSPRLLRYLSLMMYVVNGFRSVMFSGCREGGRLTYRYSSVCDVCVCVCVRVCVCCVRVVLCCVCVCVLCMCCV